MVSKSLVQEISSSALRLLNVVASGGPAGTPAGVDQKDVACLIAADLAARCPLGKIEITQAGRSYLARSVLRKSGSHIDPYLGQHLDIARRTVEVAEGRVAATVDEGESPLCWLARRKGRDGHPLIEPTQLQAGERLRSQFTRAQLTPRVTSNWDTSISANRGGAQTAAPTDAMIAARQQVRQALAAVGPEFAGLLVDVCCFLKGLTDVERERVWPPRSAKVVLQLGLDRLARHYGLQAQAHGPVRSGVRTWLADDAAFAVGAD